MHRQSLRRRAWGHSICLWVEGCAVRCSSTTVFTRSRIALWAEVLTRPFHEKGGWGMGCVGSVPGGQHKLLSDPGGRAPARSGGSWGLYDILLTTRVQGRVLGPACLGVLCRAQGTWRMRWDPPTMKSRGVGTHHEAEVPGLGHAQLPREHGLHVPGHQAVEHGVQQQHAQRLSKGEVVVHVDGTQEVWPLNACAWRTHQETGLKCPHSPGRYVCLLCPLAQPSQGFSTGFKAAPGYKTGKSQTSKSSLTVGWACI